MTAPADFFNFDYFSKFFDKRLKNKKGGGRDGLTPSAFWKNSVSSLDFIAKRCLDGTYNFSPYKEKLVLKGRSKLPRVLSLPSMRDRLVLGVLNQYLQEVFREAVNHDVPNLYMKEIGDFLSVNSSKKIYFLKTDIKSFYDTICLSLLYAKLEERLDAPILQLMKSAIETVTVSSDSSRILERRISKDVGIPQGLAISNILASISMMDFDSSIMKLCGSNGLYKRYVDDILILSTSPLTHFFLDSFKCELILQCSTLRLSREKTQIGVVGQGSFNYIGYVIQPSLTISICEKNVRSYLNRICRLTTQYKNMKEKIFLRPRFIREDAMLDGYYESVLNRKIAGFKSFNHLFGWLPYFQAMTDVGLLYKVDAVIHRKFLKGLPIEANILHLPAVYWDIKKHAGKNKLTDYDASKDIGQISDYLLRQGLIAENYQYGDDDVRNIYARHLEYIMKDAKKSIGTTY